MNKGTLNNRTPNYQAPTLHPLSLDGAMNLYVEWLTAPDGAMWPDAFITWAYKRNYRLMEVKHDKE